MPRLQNLICQIEWSGANIPLQESHTEYYENVVETLVAIPDTSTPFSIHLTSKGNTLPGLAMFVYMNNKYQCNRNRTNLILPRTGTDEKAAEINFRVRQKETSLPDETFEVEPWSFKRSETGMPHIYALSDLDYLVYWLIF